MVRSELYRAMAALELGGHVYLEADSYSGIQKIRSRVTVNDSRKPKELHGRQFKSQLFTAVSAMNPAAVQYLIKVTRIL